MKILLISTVDVGSPRMVLFNRMVQSIGNSVETLPDDVLTLCILLQNCSENRLTALRADMPPFVECSSIDRLVPLSVARNLVLRPKLISAGVDADTVVAFPDDDAWYPLKFLAGVISLFRNHADLDFWFCRYGAAPCDRDWNIAGLVAASRHAVVRKSSSNTMFLRGSVVTSIGAFDERLGLGTPLGSAEDVDYGLRAFNAARLSVLDDKILVGHRDKMPGLRSKYYPGSLFVLARHARDGGVTEFLRKLAIGLYLVILGELSLVRYLSALRAAHAAFDQAPCEGKPAQGR